MVATEVRVETQTVAFDRIPGPEPIVHYIKQVCCAKLRPYKCIEQYAFLKILSLTIVQVFVHVCWIAYCIYTLLWTLSILHMYTLCSCNVVITLVARDIMYIRVCIMQCDLQKCNYDVVPV